MGRKDGNDRGLFERPKGSGNWWICYFDNYGQKHREKGGTKSQARQLYHRRKAEVAEGRHQPASMAQPQVTVAEAIKEYVETTGKGKRSWRDDRNFASLWTGALGKLYLTQVGPKEVEHWKLTWGEQLAAGTVNRRLSFLRRVFNVQIRNGQNLKNPVTAVGLFSERNSRSRYLKPDEHERLQAVFPPGWWHVVEFALHTGLRQGEQFALKWSEVDWNVGQLVIPRSKNGRPRYVPLNECSLQILLDLQAANTLDSPWVFLGQRSRGGRNHLSANWFCRAVFNPALERAGITDMVYHDLRHSTASYLVMAGVDMRTVGEVLGHQTMQMTQRYSHLSPEHKRAAMAKLVKPKEKEPDNPET